ncbi:hypothetical protein ACS5PN_27835 [Roseateles sp. NT4]|uniref:hypothetical protein n=1 Tax=Roseateles sp. NT4 TaxID=3453715 RepID=UPI003EED4916
MLDLNAASILLAVGILMAALAAKDWVSHRKFTPASKGRLLVVLVFLTVSIFVR